MFGWLRKPKPIVKPVWSQIQSPACPKCGSSQVVPVLYGLPSEEAMEAGGRGEIAFGGCCLPSDPSQMNRWACNGCHFRWPGNMTT
jgi:hypothetical protein